MPNRQQGQLGGQTTNKYEYEKTFKKKNQQLTYLIVRTVIQESNPSHLRSFQKRKERVSALTDTTIQVDHGECSEIEWDIPVKRKEINFRM